MPAAVVLRAFAEIEQVAGSPPFRDASKTMVAFLAEEPSADKVRSLKGLDIAPDEVAVVGSDVFLHYPNGVQGAG